MRKFFSVLCLFTVLVLISGCKKDDSITNPAETIPTGNTYPRPTVFNGVTPKNILGVVRVSTVSSYTTLDMNNGLAQFGNPGVDKGDVKVTVGNKDYPFTKNTGNNGVSYIFSPTGINPYEMVLSNGGTPVSFSATEYPLTDNQVTVPGRILISTPISGLTILRSATLQVKWDASAAGDSKAICISDKNGKSYFKLVTGSTGEFTASELQKLTTGTAWVYVITYNYILSNNNETVLLGESFSFSTITLQ